LGGIVCHWAWGGKLACQKRPGEGVDRSHPTHLFAGLESLLLDGVHLPEIMGRRGPDWDSAWPLSSPGAIDPLALEGPLQRPCRGNQHGGEEPEELDADPPGAPGRVPPLELTGLAENARVGPARGSAAGPVADDQAVLPRVAEGPPEGADRDVREVQVGGDLSEGLAVEVSADDLLASRERNGARHE
jgi:hypothetical protein